MIPTTERQKMLAFAVNLSAGRAIWRPPMAHRAMDNLVTAACADAECQPAPDVGTKSAADAPGRQG
jgi:hypothetical protein